MRATLQPHPATPDGPLAAVTVHLERKGARLWVRFVADGAVDDVKWPGPAKADRTDELWRHSCFEVFVETPGGYREFNLSPSGQWASYRFDGYRAGMADATEVADVNPLDLAEDMLALEAHLDLPPASGRLALSAVIEGLDGAIQYWALAHPSDKPDFHHPDSFVLDLP
jgi:hypothetical protein